MPDQRKRPSSNARDQNLSSILETITDDGPAKLETESQIPSGERRRTPPAGEAHRPRRDAFDLEESAGPAKAPRERAPKRRSWRRELTVASLTGTAAITALIILYAPWRTESPAQISTEARTVKGSSIELEAIQTSVRLLSERMDGLNAESNRAGQRLDRRLSNTHEPIQQRLSELEQRFEHAERLEKQLASLASRLEILEIEAAESLSDERSGRPGQQSAETRDSDATNAERRWATEAPNSEALRPPAAPADQDSHAEISDSGAHRPMGETVVERPALGPTQQPPQQPVPVPLKPEVETTLTVGSIFADRASDDHPNQEIASLTPQPAKSDDTSDQEVVSITLPPAESDGHRTKNDSDVARSEMSSTEDSVASTYWAINLIALASKSKTQKLQRDYAARGVDSELIRSGRLFALRIPGLADRAEAVAHAETVKQKLGIRDVWIYEY